MCEMAYDSKLILHDPAVSASLWVGGNTWTSGSNSTSPVLLPGTPLRGLNLNMVFNSIVAAAASRGALEAYLWEGVSTGATHYLFRKYPVPITAVGQYNMRFHLDKGYKSVKFQYSFSASTGASGAGFPGALIRIGMDEGAWGNG
jgi:hypothetical protein